MKEIKSRFLGENLELETLKIGDKEINVIKYTVLRDIIHNKCPKENNVVYNIDFVRTGTDSAVVSCTIGSKDGRRIQAVREAKCHYYEGSCQYPTTRASKLAFEAAAIEFLAFEEDVVGEIEYLIAKQRFDKKNEEKKAADNAKSDIPPAKTADVVTEVTPEEPANEKPIEQVKVATISSTQIEDDEPKAEAVAQIQETVNTVTEDDELSKIGKEIITIGEYRKKTEGNTIAEIYKENPSWFDFITKKLVTSSSKDAVKQADLMRKYKTLIEK